MADHTGMAGRVREAASSLKVFTVEDLRRVARLKSYYEAGRIRDAVCDMLRRGEVEEIKIAAYRYLGRQKQRTKMDTIWHLIRSHRRFEASEIERLSGAGRRTVLEYLGSLKRLGYLEKLSKTLWRLINDPGPQTPANTEKCNRLRKLRARKTEGA